METVSPEWEIIDFTTNTSLESTGWFNKVYRFHGNASAGLVLADIDSSTIGGQLGVFNDSDVQLMVAARTPDSIGDTRTITVEPHESLIMLALRDDDWEIIADGFAARRALEGIIALTTRVQALEDAPSSGGFKQLLAETNFDFRISSSSNEYKIVEIGLDRNNIEDASLVLFNMFVNNFPSNTGLRSVNISGSKLRALTSYSLRVGDGRNFRFPTGFTNYGVGSYPLLQLTGISLSQEGHTFLFRNGDQYYILAFSSRSTRSIDLAIYSSPVTT